MEIKASKLDWNQVFKIIKAGAYVSLSAAISYFITVTSNNPELFGAFTIIINVILVTIKQIFTETK